jgi:cytochrome P450
MVTRLDFKSEAFLRDPIATVAALRQEAPVVATKFPIIGKVWVTTTYEAAARVVKDGATFALRKDDCAGGCRRRSRHSPTTC